MDTRATYRTVTVDTALRLARDFRTSERFWLELQADYDLEEAATRWAIVWKRKCGATRRDR